MPVTTIPQLIAFVRTGYDSFFFSLLSGVRQFFCIGFNSMVCAPLPPLACLWVIQCSAVRAGCACECWKFQQLNELRYPNRNVEERKTRFLFQFRFVANDDVR